MKQLLFLLLFPCLCVAQYQGNGNQKITLGEQTTADGLVYRGLAADTTRKPSVDTMAFILLDTNTNIIWQYKNAVNNAWTRVGGSVGNGGTGQITLTANKVMVGNGTSGVLTPTNLHWDNTNSRLGLSISSPLQRLDVNGLGRFSDGSQGLIIGAYTGGAGYGAIYPSTVTPAAGNYLFAATLNQSVLNCGDNIQLAIGGAPAMSIINNSNVGIGVSSPTQKLHVVGNGRFTAVGAGTFANNLNITSDGTLTTATSDEKYKYNILPISYGLNTILQLKPVNFQWIEGEENDLGFIAQDVADIIPEAVNANWNSDLLMRYESIIPILTKAIQEQNALIKALEQRILILENK